MPISRLRFVCWSAGLFVFAAAPVLAQGATPSSNSPPPILIPTVSPAPNPKKHRSFPRIGVDFGTFSPGDRRTKDTFGGSWTSLGLGIGGVKQALSKGKWSFDLSTYSKKSGDTHAFLAPIGVEYRRALVPYEPGHRPPFLPYAGGTLDYVATDLCSPKDDVHSRFRFTQGGSVFLGATVGERGFIEGRYLGLGKVRGFNLSGIKFDVGIRF